MSIGCLQLQVSLLPEKDSVQFSLNRAGKTSNFVNNRPSVPWVQKFVKRHNISLRTPETIDLGKALLNPEDLEKWADRVMRYLKLVNVSMSAQ